MKEPYVKPELKSEVLEPEALTGGGSGPGTGGDGGYYTGRGCDHFTGICK